MKALYVCNQQRFLRWASNWTLNHFRWCSVGAWAATKILYGICLNCPTLEFYKDMFVGVEAFFIATAVHTRDLQRKKKIARLFPSWPGGNPTTCEATEPAGNGEALGMATGNEPATGEVIDPAAAAGPEGIGGNLNLDSPAVPATSGGLLSARGRTDPAMSPDIMAGAAVWQERMDAPSALAAAGAGPLPAAGERMDPGPGSVYEAGASRERVDAIPAPEAADGAAQAGGEREPESEAERVQQRALEPELEPAAVPAAESQSWAEDMEDDKTWWPAWAHSVDGLASAGAGLYRLSDLGPREAAVEEYTAVANERVASRVREESESETGSGSSDDESSNGGSLDADLANGSLMVDLGLAEDSARQLSADLLIWLLSNVKIQLPIMNSILGVPDHGSAETDVLEIACGGEPAKSLVLFIHSQPKF